ncbi:MAG: Smr/MutS family protein, partial [Myxococcales bacterium]|nr:Smr/MutS family protein [Myxococcales bacterium]
HRDVKPHNLGFTPVEQKRARHLILFDFSLSAEPADRTDLGTVAYRDPWLPLRKAWDHAADRYAAALTMHEMLTGIRPDYGDGGHPATVRDAHLRLDATRFPQSVRNGLVAFFERALAREASDRYPDAGAMRFAWERVFRDPGAFEPRLVGLPKHTAWELPDDLSPEARLESFVHAPLLLDALHRAGAETALEAARLPRNQLSVVRGAGRETRSQILELVDALQDRLRTSLANIERVLPDFHLAPEPLLSLDRDLLSAKARRTLHDAGITTTRALATCPVDEVERILKPLRIKATRVRRDLEAWISQADQDGAAPATLPGWLELFLERGHLAGKASKTGRRTLNKAQTAGHAWCGLSTGSEEIDQALGQRPHDPLLAFARTSEIAEAVGSKQPNVSNAIGKARDHWQALPQKPAFAELVRGTLRGIGGAAPLTQAAQSLLDAIPRQEASPDPDLAIRHAAALLRIACALTDSDDAPLLVFGNRTGPVPDREAEARESADRSPEDRVEARALAVGDKVRVRSMKQDGEVVALVGSPPRKATVQLALLRTTVAIDDLAPLRPEPTSLGKRRVKGVKAAPVFDFRASVTAQAATHFGPDAVPIKTSVDNVCDLRGERFEDAQDRVADFVAEALARDQDVILIRHGHGGGALRKAVRDCLGRLANVRSFRPGLAREGGDGVTVVWVE